MTPEIKMIDAEIRALEVRRYALMQTYLESQAIAKAGDLITWGRQDRKRRGRVVSVCGLYGDVGYQVINIKKDGTDGATVRVCRYDKPVRVDA